MNDELVERVTALYEELKRPIFVWAMANGRYDTLKIDQVPDTDPRVRGALTSIHNAARDIDTTVRNYALMMEAAELEMDDE